MPPPPRPRPPRFRCRTRCRCHAGSATGNRATCHLLDYPGGATQRGGGTFLYRPIDHRHDFGRLDDDLLHLRQHALLDDLGCSRLPLVGAARNFPRVDPAGERRIAFLGENRRLLDPVFALDTAVEAELPVVMGNVVGRPIGNLSVAGNTEPVETALDLRADSLDALQVVGDVGGLAAALGRAGSSGGGGGHGGRGDTGVGDHRC